MDNFEVLQKKISKFIRNYAELKEEVDKLRAANKFLNKEVDKLRKTNFDLIEFKNRQERVVGKIKKVLKKIDSLKGV